jgi:hypothetical protein
MRPLRRPRVRHRGLLAAAVAVALGAAVPATSQASPSARLEVALVPEQLGRDTTIEFGFRIQGPHGTVPPPVTKIALSYPAGFGIVTSGLGLQSCRETSLEEVGVEGCPSQSLMGYGTATGDIQIGPEVIEESGATAVFMAPFQNGDIALQFYLNAEDPLAAQLIFPGLLLPARAPFGGDLTITVPLIESFPDGPDVALVRLRSTIGPLGITYYDRIHGKFVPYHPNGILLPRRCPRGGFPFAAAFTFAAGAETTAHAAVPCPRHMASRGSARTR